jgi:valyl-tRNA synthetase
LSAIFCALIKEETMSDTQTPADTLSSKYDPSTVEAHWYAVWEKAGYFKANETSEAPAFTIVIPPPNVTGSLHMGHAMYVLEDVMTRYHRMRGDAALWLPGTDHAGIATQMVVERQLRRKGLTRHDLGREKFVEEVWTWKQQSGNRIYEQLRVLGFSLDWSRERFTMDPKLSQAVKTVFVSLFRDDLLYRDTRLINWCPRCITALSDLEVEPDDEQKSSIWSIAYPVTGTDRLLVVATTRPETMLGDTAVAVHPEDERYKDLIGKTVKLPLTDREIPIIADAILVDPAFGTGVVKVTPGHDFNDYETGKRHKLPIISVLDERALLNENVAERFRGMNIWKARKAVLAELEALGLLVETKPHLMKIPTCQRCETVVEPMISTQWFVKMKPLARPAINAVEHGFTKIYPEYFSKTYFHWMNNIQDWCVSRQLWWGHQIPAWYGPNGQVFVAISEEEALAAATKYYAQEAKLFDKVHDNEDKRAQVVKLQMINNYYKIGAGVFLVQDEDVLDTWFSSALWPFSTLGWPEKTLDLKKFYPNSVLETGFDILFFWVARMMVMGLYCLGEVPFKAVYLHGMVRDDENNKMSKTKGNVIDPLDVVYGINGPDFYQKVSDSAKDVLNDEEVTKIVKRAQKKFPNGLRMLDKDLPDLIKGYGVDALRFALSIQATAGRDIKFDISRVEEYRTFANKIWNASRFAMMNLGGFIPEGFSFKREHASIYDRWIRHRAGEVAQIIDEKLNAMEFAPAAQEIYHFYWNEFCDWYIELSKASFTPESNPEERRQAQATLVFVLDLSMRLLHAFMPFITEEIWQKLPRLSSHAGGSAESPSIMVAPFPNKKTSPALRAATPQDQEAVSVFILVRDSITALRNLRGELGVSDKQSLGIAYVSGAKETIEVLQQQLKAWQRLAGITAFLPESERPAGSAASALVQHPLGNIDLSICLDGLVDFAQEAARLQKEIAKSEKELEKITQKLSNEAFVARAPKEVLDKERERETAERNRLESMQQKLTQYIKSLEKQEKP